ncbi:MAG TPA: hypothetical protein VNS79_14845 [Sphingobium sp.]|nr:hypothetical protein [Sphingobium sp.]
MTLSDPLRQALLDYAAIERNVSAANPDRDDEARWALVRDRRLLSEQIGRLGLLIERDEALAADSDTQRETSQRFTAMRYALALHQADWPVVRIDENPAAYRASAHQVQIKSAAFWRWCREGLNLRDHAGTVS